MVRFVLALAFLLALAAVEKASAGGTFCAVGEDGVPICDDDNYFYGPG